MTKNEDKITASNNTIGSTIPKKKYVAGESVDEHTFFEEANIILTGDEILQQNENL
ncbi:hypothetical protein ABES03_23150 [Neobacillus rhizosphaerae]|uniref:hypothetical protein n=1 Tax=Neobacillus rhizosphaerae TaxID=2880965 RepID=UPI003D2B7F25